MASPEVLPRRVRVVVGIGRRTEVDQFFLATLARLDHSLLASLGASRGRVALHLAFVYSLCH